MAASFEFERPEHRRVLGVLQALDGERLASCRAVFGGGTRIALELDEFRCSAHVDLLVSDRQGYAELRNVARSRSGARALFRSDIDLPREARVDQYGIRFPVRIDDQMIKVEIIAEGRIDLDAGDPKFGLDLPWASLVDCYAEKLLANSDRGLDEAFLSRDLVDLAALRMAHGAIPEPAWTKAVAAYGGSVREDLLGCCEKFISSPSYRDRCLARLDVRAPERVLSGVELLRDDPPP